MISNGLSTDGRYIAFMLRTGFPSLKRPNIRMAADYAYEKHGVVPVFIPLERGKDEAASGWPLKYEDSGTMIINTPKRQVALGILSRMDVVSRLRPTA